MRQTHIKQQTQKQSQNDVQYKAAKPKKKLFHLTVVFRDHLTILYVLVLLCAFDLRGYVDKSPVVAPRAWNSPLADPYSV